MPKKAQELGWARVSEGLRSCRGETEKQRINPLRKKMAWPRQSGAPQTGRNSAVMATEDRAAQQSHTGPAQT